MSEIALKNKFQQNIFWEKLPKPLHHSISSAHLPPSLQNPPPAFPNTEDDNSMSFSITSGDASQWYIKLPCVGTPPGPGVCWGSSPMSPPQKLVPPTPPRWKTTPNTIGLAYSLPNIFYRHAHILLSFSRLPTTGDQSSSEDAMICPTYLKDVTDSSGLS